MTTTTKKRPRVLVTGATGFLGPYILQELVNHGYQVRAFGRNIELGNQLVRENISFFLGDLRKETDVYQAAKDMDYVVHAGALSTIWGKWQDFYETNVLGTQTVLEVCKKLQIKRLVYISSPSIYTAKKEQLGLKETDAPQENHLNHYIKSKLESEKLFASYPEVPSVILRPRGLFGVGDTSILPRVIHLSKRLGIPLVGNGQQIMDMTCVENVAYAVRLALEAPQAIGQTYNITNGEPKRFKELIELTLTGLNLPIRYRRIPGFLLSGAATAMEWLYKGFRSNEEPPFTRYTYCLLRYSLTLDITKAEQELGYKPILTIEEGIKQYVKSYRNH